MSAVGKEEKVHHKGRGRLAREEFVKMRCTVEDMNLPARDPSCVPPHPHGLLGLLSYLSAMGKAKNVKGNSKLGN
jgi:hypothetical protein